MRLGLVLGLLLGALVSSTAHAVTFRVLHSFGANQDGHSPTAGLILDQEDGILFGVTPRGGAHGFGTLFEISTLGDFYTTAYSFTAADGIPTTPLLWRGGNLIIATVHEQAQQWLLQRFVDGHLQPLTAPIAGLAPHGAMDIDRLGNIYFVTRNCIVGKAAPGHPHYSVQVLHNPNENSNRIGSACNGGTTYYGGYVYGTTAFDEAGKGALFRVPGTGGTATILTELGSGFEPRGDLTVDTTGVVGAMSGAIGPATGPGIYRYDFRNGFSVLYQNVRGRNLDGAKIYSGVAEHGGFLYGATSGDVSSVNFNSIYRVKPGDTIKEFIHKFAAGQPVDPARTPIVDAKGVIYGVTTKGGAHGFGMIFRIDP